MLTKSTYTKAITCLKTLWRDKYKNEPKSTIDKTTQTRLETGKQVGALTRYTPLVPSASAMELSFEL